MFRTAFPALSALSALAALALAAPAAAHVSDAATPRDGHGTSVTLVAAEPAAPAPDHAVRGLDITAPFARATLPNAPVAGGFLSVTNHGTRDDRLIAAASPVAARVELHRMAMEGDVMRMRQLADGLPVPAGQTVALTPGGDHIMFMDLHAPLIEGDTIPVTLTFERAGKVEIAMPVAARDARAASGPAAAPAAPAAGHDGHSGMAQ